MKRSYAQFLLKKTENDYNKISSLFSNKRSYLSPDILEFKKYIKKGDKVGDIGCGNGRLYELVESSKADYYGYDISAELINISQKKYPDAFFVQIDSTTEIDSNSFDVVFCLAVLHHVPGEEMRGDFTKELYRILKPGGKLILTVWNLSGSEGIYKIPKSIEAKELDPGDIFYPFKDLSGGVLVDRYIHCFSTTELSSLIKESGFNIVELGINQRGKRKVNENLVIVALKPPV